MIAAFSTSSPWASVALLDGSGRVLASGSNEAAHHSGAACLSLLKEQLQSLGAEIGEIQLFVADTGPGSFTGVKVGVMLAKTLAFALGAKVAGVLSFDLYETDRPIAIPSRRGVWFFREPGVEPRQIEGVVPSGAVGYGSGIEPPTFPRAELTSRLVARLAATAPESLMPTYLAEPLISTPNKPYRTSAVGAGPG